MNPTFLAILVIGVLVIVFINYYLSRAKKRRIENLKSLAQSQGFSFHEIVPDKILRKVLDFYIYKSEGHPEANNLIQGQSDGHDFYFFDYHYTTGDQKISTRHHTNLILLTDPSMNLPFFTLRPENLVDKIGGYFGLDDIDFKDYPEFSSEYLLRGKDEPAIRQTFNDGIIKFYESHGGMYTEGQDQRLLITIEGYGDLVPADKIMEFIDRSWEIFRLFKK